MTNKAIPSILFLSGVLSKGAFSAVEIANSVKAFQHGNVIPVLDTLAILTSDKFSPLRNKKGTENLREKVTAVTVGAKTNFRKLGFALALVDVLEQEPSEELGFLFCELAKTHSADLKSVYESSKPAKNPAPVLTPARVEKAAEPAEPESVSAANEAITLTVDELINTAIDAIKSGLLSATQIEEMRIALSLADDAITPMATPMVKKGKAKNHQQPALI